MKKYILFTLLATLLFAGCGKDKVDYTNNGSSSNGGNTNTQYGYLELPSTIYVDLSSENFEEVQTKADGDNQIEAGDNYIVTITNLDDNTQTYKDTYGNLKAEEELALRPAPYNITIVSTEDIPYMSQKAEYAASKDFAIVGGMTTVIENLACTMSNIKVSVSFSADILELFQEDVEDATQNLNIKVELGENEANYGRNEIGQATFFRAVESSNVITLSLTGMYNTAPGDLEPVYEMIEDWHHTITGVKAGQWRNISINVEHADAGNADFTVTVDSWVYDPDGGIDVDITSDKFQAPVREDVLDDPENYITDTDAPAVTLGSEAVSLDEGFLIDQNRFSINSFLKPICVDPLILNATSAEGSQIKSAWIEFTSDNEKFNAVFEQKFGEKRRAYLYPESDYFAVNETVFTATYDAMYELYQYNGTHTATIMMEDTEERKSFNTLKITTDNGNYEPEVQNPPVIDWRGGMDFDERHTIDPTNGLAVVIDIASESGITAFTLEINSEVLTPELLTGIGLASTMDLINPGECESGLSALEFPLGDAVEGKTELIFDISSFMPMLVLQGAGDSNFVLNVTDNGGTTSKVLKLRVE